MQDPHAMNGHPSLKPPSVYDILYEIKGQIGGVQYGQRVTLQAVEKAFDRIADLQDRVSRLEVGQSRTDRPDSLLKCIREALPDIREIIFMIMLIAAGLGLAGAPSMTEVATIIGAAKPSD